MLSASFNVLYFISGTITLSLDIFVSSLSSLSSKYGKTSPSICPAIGAATAPPWVILTTQIYTAFTNKFLLFSMYSKHLLNSSSNLNFIVIFPFSCT